MGSQACTACPPNSLSPAGSVAATDCTCNAGYTGANGAGCSPCVAGTFKAAAGSEACVGCPAGKVSPPASVAASACEEEETGEEEEEEGEDKDKDEGGGEDEQEQENEPEQDKDEGGGDDHDHDHDHDHDKRVTCNKKKTARASEPMSSDCAAELRNAKQNKQLDDLYERCRTALDFRKRCPQICW